MGEIKFTAHERRRLEAALSEAEGKREFVRLRALWLLGEGWSVPQTALSLGVTAQSVRNWMERWQGARSLDEFLCERPRKGRPRVARELTAKRLLSEWRRDPIALGYSATVWTVSLLSRHLRIRCGIQITARTLRRRLHEAGLRWKRPRHAFAHKAPNYAQKKGR